VREEECPARDPAADLSRCVVHGRGACPALPPGSRQPARNPANVHVSRNLLCCHSFLPNQMLLDRRSRSMEGSGGDLPPPVAVTL
jgi:hypothetical protein